MTYVCWSALYVLAQHFNPPPSPLPIPPLRVSVDHSHGFGWSDGADAASNILPLYNYVKNFGRTDDGGYYGK